MTPCIVDFKYHERTLLNLCTIDLHQATGPSIIHHLDLLSIFPKVEKNIFKKTPSIYYDDRGNIIVESDEMAMINLSDPANPVLESTTQFVSSQNLKPLSHDSEQGYKLELLNIVGLSPKERLNAWFELGVHNDANSMSGDIWARYDDGILMIYRLIGLDEREAVFQPMSHLRSTPIERMVHDNYTDLLIHNGYCYALHRYGVAVFDIHDPQHPKRAGYYNAPHETFNAIAPLPNGRVLLGGNNLHVIAPPR